MLSLVLFTMLWPLLRAATKRGFCSNPLYRLQNSRLSHISSVRFDGIISRHFWHGPQRRIICTRCFKELNIAKDSTSHQARSLKMFSSLLPGVNRRFIGTRSRSNSYNSASNTRNKTTAIYVIALAVTVVGFSYLAVPLYRLYCQVSQLLLCWNSSWTSSSLPRAMNLWDIYTLQGGEGLWNGTKPLYESEAWIENRN